MTAPALGLVLWKVYYRRKGRPATAVEAVGEVGDE
jgi:hypothetical protein